jgi:hypothetical protein
MIVRYRALPAGDIRGVLEMALDDLTDEEVFMALFDGHVDSPHSIHSLAHSIRNLAVGRKPSDEWAGAYEVWRAFGGIAHTPICDAPWKGRASGAC